MTSIRVHLHISMLLLHIFAKGQVPTTGCDAISSGGTCYSYFSTAAGIDWVDSRLQCVSQGYNLATITSSEDNTLVYNIATSGLYCWIGLNDINTENTFVWVDGSNNPYRNWDVNQPDNFMPDQDCTLMWGQGYWDDDYCTLKRKCYFCGSNVNVFGEVTGSTYSSLEDNTVLISDTTLYCITENKNTPQVTWSYVDLAGTRTDLASTTNASTGASTIQVYTTQPGYYSCEVTENGGSSRMYTAVMTDTNPDTESTQRITNLRAETQNQTSILVTWELLETNQILQNMTFSIHLGFGIYEGLAGTTTDFHYVLSNLSQNANYSIRVESAIPYSTQEISSTIYHFLEFDKVTGPLQISNLLSDYLPFILIGGILIIVILFVLVVIIVVTCCIMKRRAVKHSTTPNPDTNPIIFEQPAHANEIYEQVLGDAINEQIVKPPTYANTKIFEQPAYANEAYELVPGDAINEQIVECPTYATILEKKEEKIGQYLPIYRSPI